MGRLPTGKRKAAKTKRLKLAGVEVQDPWAVPEQPEPLPTPKAQRGPGGR